MDSSNSKAHKTKAIVSIEVDCNGIDSKVLINILLS